MGVTESHDKKNKLNASDVAIPCGVAAKYFFNDMYTMKNSKGENINISGEGIAW